MDESAELPIQEAPVTVPKAPITPVIKPNSGPETAEQENKVDILIVFGQGPVKPLLRDSELDPEMKAKWETFKTDPLHNDEPDFRVLDEVFVKQLEELTEEEQQDKLEKWQALGRFGLNRWGRENALAAGYALVSGYSKKVLLSGGKTIPGWAKEKLPPGRIEKWPSEAQLMADIIKRRFGASYEELYGEPIESAFILEDASTNTLENFANSLNQNPELLDDKTKIGLLAADFHIPRSERIAALFAPNSDVERQDSAQNLLGTVAQARNKEIYKQILGWMSDPKNPDLHRRIDGETRFSNGLRDPQFITYWLGYIGLAQDPSILQHTIQRFGSDPQWSEAARSAFEIAGLSYDNVISKDLNTMPEDEFRQIANKLTILMKEGYRSMPPPVSS